jgi:benzylsuccinate CoA-transferase BbsE subunit
MTSPLHGIRVLELAGQEAAYCGRLLADLGAEVLKVEPPEGDECRYAVTCPPAPVESDPTCYRFTFLNAGKKGVVLDLKLGKHRDLLQGLIARADVLIHAFSPAYQERLKLRSADLEREFPRLIVAAVTAFGEGGPYAAYHGDDLACLALGGMLNLAGRPDGPPLRVHGSQSFMIGSLYAANATLLALLARDADGLGQSIDVSIQECVANTTENAVQFFDLEGFVRGRTGMQRADAATGIFSCADGEIYLISSLQGALLGWEAVPAWLRNEHVDGSEDLEAPQWRDTQWRRSAEAIAAFDRIFGGFCVTRTKLALYESGQAAGVNLCPINSPLDVCNDPQLHARGFFTEVCGETRRHVKFPGVPYRLTKTPARIVRLAPRLGEHTAEVLAAWLGSDEAMPQPSSARNAQ